METTDEVKDKNIATIDPIIEERYKKEKEFNKERKMFYFDNNGNIHFPPTKYKNSSHDEWFKACKIDIESVIRGHIYHNNAYCYIGKDFRIPNLTFEEYSILIEICNVWCVYIGLHIGEVGEVWKGIYRFDVYEAN